MRTALVSGWTLFGVKVETAERNGGSFEAAAMGPPANSLSLNQKGGGAPEVCAKEKKHNLFFASS